LAPCDLLSAVDDGSGTLIGVFHEACGDIGDVALMHKPNPTTLADRRTEALDREMTTANSMTWIAALYTALGQTGFEHMKQRNGRSVEPPGGEAGWRRDRSGSWLVPPPGRFYADDMAGTPRVSTVRLALREIADAPGDADAFIERQRVRNREKGAEDAAETQWRLLIAGGRVKRGVAVIEATEHRQLSGSWDWPDFEWEDARTDVLESEFRRADDAQPLVGCL